MRRAIICFTRAPIPGQTKTRLMPRLTGEQCAVLHRAFLRDLSRAFAQVDADLYIAYTPEGGEAALREFFPAARTLFPQRGEDLGSRMEGALDRVLELGPENVTVHTLALKKGSRLMDGAPNKGKALVGERTSGGMSEFSWKQGNEGYKAREDEEGGSAIPTGEAVAAMLDYAWGALRAAGQRPYYLYRQKYMSGSFENVGWCRPGTESLYNICMMEELHTIVSLGGGGVTKLVDRATGYIERLANAKYPQEYIQKIDAICADKGRVAQFYAAHGR